MLPPAFTLTTDDVDALALGAALLGCGGGGRVGQLRTLLAHATGDALATVVPASSASGVANVYAVGYIGSITVMEEKLPGGEEIVDAVAAAVRWTGVPADALMPVQIGGVCGLSAVAAAHRLGCPVVDADFEGRAVPRLDQFSLAAAGHPAPPLALTVPGGMTLVLDGTTNQEAVMRAVVAESGGWGALALGPLAVASLPDIAITGTMSAALSVGRALQECLGVAAELVGEALGGRTLAHGRVISVARTAQEESFVHGSFAVLDAETGAVVRIEAGSEYLLVALDGDVVVTCPDIISVLDARTRTPIDAELLGPEQEVIVVALPGPAWWTASPSRLARVSPRSYGIELDYVALQLV
ncbi:DUF917 domain-containing protein [Specibacter cremeus]|uniref:DUF917 domain-containing protein n=1 Tax=Specibacter cremeus TaxID=1629051 RepID=UPI000F79AE30|nr:DUF917 domain-containing protein [Specibacter cremeus]